MVNFRNPSLDINCSDSHFIERTIYSNGFFIQSILANLMDIYTTCTIVPFFIFELFRLTIGQNRKHLEHLGGLLGMQQPGISLTSSWILTIRHALFFIFVLPFFKILCLFCLIYVNYWENFQFVALLVRTSFYVKMRSNVDNNYYQKT